MFVMRYISKWNYYYFCYYYYVILLSSSYRFQPVMSHDPSVPDDDDIIIILMCSVYLFQRLPEQIKEKNEKLKEEMMGKEKKMRKLT